MSQQEDDLRALAKIMDMLRGVSIVLVAMNLYWFCSPIIPNWRFDYNVLKIISNFNTGFALCANPWNAKFYAVILLALSCFGTKGVKSEKVHWREIWIILSAGATLFFLNWWMPGCKFFGLYIASTLMGFVCLLLGGIWMSRLLKNTMMDDRFNE